MKFAIPLEQGKLTDQFGHCKNFAFISIDDGGKIAQSEVIETPAHQPGLIPMWLYEQGVSHVIAGSLGEKAKTLMELKQMEVMVGAPSLAPEILVEQYLDGSLLLAENSCDHTPIEGEHCLDYN